MPKTKSGVLPLNLREKAFIKYYIQTRKIGESALRAGFSSPVYGTNLLKKEKIKTAVQEALEKKGLTLDYALGKVKEGCEAMVPAKKTKDGKTLVSEHPDHFNRKPYVEMIFKLGEHFPNQKIEIEESKKVTIINVNLDMQVAQGLLDSGKISLTEFEEIRAYLPQGELQHEPIRENKGNRQSQKQA